MMPVSRIAVHIALLVLSIPSYIKSLHQTVPGFFHLDGVFGIDGEASDNAPIDAGGSYSLALLVVMSTPSHAGKFAGCDFE